MSTLKNVSCSIYLCLYHLQQWEWVHWKHISYSIYPCLYHLQWEWAHWKTYHIPFIPAFIIYGNENEHIEKHIISHLSLPLSSTTRMSTLKNIPHSICPCFIIENTYHIIIDISNHIFIPFLLKLIKVLAPKLRSHKSLINYLTMLI